MRFLTLLHVNGVIIITGQCVWSGFSSLSFTRSDEEARVHVVCVLDSDRPSFKIARAQRAD